MYPHKVAGASDASEVQATAPRRGGIHRKWLIPLVFLVGACAAPPRRETPAADPAAAAYHEALGQVTLATGDVRGALALRAERAAAAERAPTPSNCRRLLEAADLLGRHRDRLDVAYADLAARAAPWPRRARAAEVAAATTRAAAAADRAWRAAWEARCVGLPPVAEPEPAPPARVRSLCDDLRLHGRAVNVIGPAWADRALRPAGGLAVARRLARELEDDLDVLFVVLDGRRPEDGGHRSGVYLERGTAGLGAPAPTPPEALPGWRRLRSVVVLGGADGLRRGPSLRGLALAHAGRLTLPGCLPGPGAGWGWSDIGGQLGGAAPGSIEEVAPGRFRLRGLRGDPGLVANGGNSVPYAPLELYLMGLLPRQEVPAATFLRHPRPEADGLVAADGLCRLDAAALAVRFGERPLDPDPWRVGVAVVSDRPLDSAAMAQYRAEAIAFTAEGPDDDPALLNFFEATGGRGRLALTAPRPRPGERCTEAR